MLFAAILSLPVILYELYGFVLPAFSPRERRVANSLVGSIPVLFAIGVLFGYFVVLPAAVHFFQNFNAASSTRSCRPASTTRSPPRSCWRWVSSSRSPSAILAATRLGIVTPAQLRRYRRYAMLVCALVAAFLPGDVITMILETVPLYLLYELSILVATIAAAARGRAGAAGGGRVG